MVSLNSRASFNRLKSVGNRIACSAIVASMISLPWFSGGVFCGAFGVFGAEPLEGLSSGVSLSWQS